VGDFYVQQIQKHLKTVFVDRSRQAEHQKNQQLLDHIFLTLTLLAVENPSMILRKDPVGAKAVIILEDGWKVDWLKNGPSLLDVGKVPPLL